MDSEPGCQEILHHPVQLVSHALEFSLDLQDSLSLPGLAGLHFFPLPDFSPSLISLITFWIPLSL